MTDAPEYSSGKNVLVVANPGTGKTTELANRVISLLKSGVEDREILCITFTNKAADEMHDKINSLIGKDEILKGRIYNITISTFHSYALNYLQSRGKDYGLVSNNFMRFSIYRSFAQSHALNYSREYVISKVVPKVENSIRYLKSFGILPGNIDYDKTSAEIERIYSEEKINNITLEENLRFLQYFVEAFRDYENSKNSLGNAIDYNDMLLKFLELHQENGESYRYVLVDELQDVSEIEASIAKVSGDNLFMVGDRKQSIFGFQGGSIRNFESIEESGQFEVMTKSLNHRSTENVLKYSKEYFLKYSPGARYSEELGDFRGESGIEGEKTRIISTNNPVNMAVHELLSQIQADDDERKKIAIITRTNDQILEISRYLDRKGIEYSTTASASTSNSARADIIEFLNGILHDSIELKIKALFSPFSGVRLKNAFKAAEMCKNRNCTLDDIRPYAENFLEIDELAFSRNDIYDLFEKRIMPFAISISRDYYITASAILNAIMEFFDSEIDPTRENLFDFLEVTEDSYEPVGKPRRIVLTTVHKAKGLEFDSVIYVPKDSRKDLSFIDVITYSIIKTSKGIDVREELDLESIRVDFVAFTRAKSRLAVITDQRNLEKYYISGFSETEQLNSDEEREGLTRNFDEAYSLFVAGKFDESMKILNKKDPWLIDLITNYFVKSRTLSYTSVMGLRNPYEFVKNNILMITRIEPALSLGRRIHSDAQRMFLGDLNLDELQGDERVFAGNIEKVNDLVREKYDAAQTGAEESVKIPLSHMFDEYGDSERNLNFVGKIDALFKNGDDGKVMILDYKTDKTSERASEHRRQLAVYKRLYSIQNRIPEDNIVVGLGFIGLRGKINTGNIGCSLDDKQPAKNQLNRFKEYIDRFLAYRSDINEFIKDLMEVNSSELLFERIRKEIEDNPRVDLSSF